MVLTTLSRTFEKKGTTNYVQFIEHDGKVYRLNFEVAIGLEDQALDLMALQAAKDLADTELINSINAKGYDPETYDELIGRWTEAGYEVVS